MAVYRAVTRGYVALTGRGRLAGPAPADRDLRLVVAGVRRETADVISLFLTAIGVVDQP
ncbi:hypothetical protein [Amycolatopsis anabasis]|uniref:hypothetical protein n=1 Tax=Amycolatopsis anabasis TaxID=1840409 RepID=UPI00131E40A5|nr:hypothetical protein [Amycolatopsis anabasis]